MKKSIFYKFAPLFILAVILLLAYQNCTDINLSKQSVSTLSPPLPIIPNENNSTPTSPHPNAPPTNSLPPPSDANMTPINDDRLQCADGNGNQGYCYPQLVNNNGCFRLGFRVYQGPNGEDIAPIFWNLGQTGLYTIPMVITQDTPNYTTTFSGGNSTNLFAWISRRPGDFESIRRIILDSSGQLSNSQAARNLRGCWNAVLYQGGDLKWTTDPNWSNPAYPSATKPCYLERGQTYYLNFTTMWVDPRLDNVQNGRIYLNPNDVTENILLREGRMGSFSTPGLTADISCNYYAP